MEYLSVFTSVLLINFQQSCSMFICVARFFILFRIKVRLDLNRFDFKVKNQFFMCVPEEILLLFYDNRDSFGVITFYIFFLLLSVHLDLLCILSVALEVTSHHTSCELVSGQFFLLLLLSHVRFCAIYFH